MLGLKERLGETVNALGGVFLINALVTVVGLATNVAVARLFGKEAFGVFVYFFSLVSFVSLFSQFGFQHSVPVSIVRDKKESREIVKYALKLVSFFSIVFFLISFLITELLRLNPGVQFFNMVVLLSVLSLSNFSILFSTLRGFKFFFESSLYSLYNRLILLLLVVFVAFFTKGIIFVLVSFSLAIILIAPFLIKRLKGLLLVDGDFNRKTFFLVSFVFFLSTISINTYFFLDQLLVKYLFGFEKLAEYSAYSTLPGALKLISVVFPLVLVPLANEKRYNILNALKKMFFVFSLPMVFIIAMNEFFVQIFFGSGYYLPLIVTILLVGISFLLAVYIFLNSIFLGENTYDRFLLKVIGLDVILSVVLLIGGGLIAARVYGLVGVLLVIIFSLVLKSLLNLYGLVKLRKRIV